MCSRVVNGCLDARFMNVLTYPIAAFLGAIEQDDGEDVVANELCVVCKRNSNILRLKVCQHIVCVP